MTGVDENKKTRHRMGDKNKCLTGEQRGCAQWERSYIVLWCCSPIITG